MFTRLVSSVKFSLVVIESCRAAQNIMSSRLPLTAPNDCGSCLISFFVAVIFFNFPVLSNAPSSIYVKPFLVKSIWISSTYNDRDVFVIRIISLSFKIKCVTSTLISCGTSVSPSSSLLTFKARCISMKRKIQKLKPLMQYRKKTWFLLLKRKKKYIIFTHYR